ncbi:adenylate kinase [bacterium]|nr:adenylate kinase [bacterium]
MRLVFFGPPGGGKGTQAQRVSKDAKAAHIATGDLLREAKAKGTPAGKKAAEYMDRGALVPDEVVNAVLRERLSQPDAKDGYLLDGYPRTVAQAASLEKLLAEMKVPPEKYVFISVPEKLIEERILLRRSCKKCGRVYNLKYNPPPKPDRCECGGELFQRPDDSAEKLRTRLDAYKRDTLPVIERLEKEGKLSVIEAGASGLDEVEALVRGALGLPLASKKK